MIDLLYQRPNSGADMLDVPHTADFLIMSPPIGKGAVSVAFVHPSVCPSVSYIANSSKTQKSSVPKFGRKVPHLRCDSHTSF